MDDYNRVIVNEVDYKLRQRLRNLLPHCNTILLTVALENKIKHLPVAHIAIFIHDIKWCIKDKYYDLFMQLYHARENTYVIRHTPEDIVKNYPLEFVMMILSRGYVKSTDLFTAAVEAENLPVVKAIHHGGYKTAQITIFDLPSAARLDYMERGIGIDANSESMCQFLSAAGLLLEGAVGDSYDPYNTTGWGAGSFGYTYSNDDFRDHVFENESVFIEF